MNDYEKLKEFWNTAFASSEPEEIRGYQFDAPVFHGLLEKGLKGAETALDYGCGSGWGLFEMHYTNPAITGLGIDQSENGVAYANRCAVLSGLSDKLAFRVGDASRIGNAQFDFILTVNLLDVVPADICDDILHSLHRALKKDRRILVCLNPEFTNEEMTGMIGMEKRGDYYYKNDILRARCLTRAQWTVLFERFFFVEEITPFALSEREKAHPRIAYLMRKG